MSVSKSIKFYPLIASCSMNSTALIYSAPIDLRSYDEMALQAKWTGTPTGNFFLDASINYGQGTQPFDASSGDWVPSSTSIFQALGTSALVNYPPFVLQNTNNPDLRQIAYPWARLRYVPTTGATSGVLNVWIAAKRLS